MARFKYKKYNANRLPLLPQTNQLAEEQRLTQALHDKYVISYLFAIIITRVPPRCDHWLPGRYFNGEPLLVSR